MAMPCDGLRVLDFSLGMPGNLATMILADYGAEVVKVESPSGDPWRAQPAWTFWNRGKSGLVADLKTAEGRARIEPLLREADVVVESFRPGVTGRLGIDYETVSRLNSAVIYCSITGFGARSPFAHLKGYEAIVNAKTGRLREFSGIADRAGPGYAAVASASCGASHGALQGILAALHRRRETGCGSHVETSLLQGNTAYDMVRWFAIQRAETNALAKDRLTTWGALTRQVPRPNYQTAVTKDGVWLQFANTMPHLFMAQMNAIGLTQLYEDPRWADLPALRDPADSEGVWEAVLDRVRSKTWAEWKAILDREKDVNVEPFLTTEQSFDHPQVRHNGHVVEVGGQEQVGLLVDLKNTPGRPGSAAPPAGANTVPHWGPRPATFAANGTGADARPPLDGVVVVDFASYYATPFGSSLLADYGARVIKVEPPEGEYSRYVAGRLLAFKTTGGKESLAIDLKQPEAREVIRRLLAKADVVLHNFRPGVPERLGIGYDDVRAINPSIVYHYGASYGADGPYAAKPAFHPTAGAISGGALHQMPSAALSADDPHLPMDRLKQLAWRMLQANEGNPDVSAALAVGSALLLGLQARSATGQGQPQLTTMICSNLYANGDDGVRFAGKPPRPEPDVDLLGLGPLYRLYPAKEGWLFLACPFESEWQALARVLGHPEWLEDSCFASATARATNAAELALLLEASFASRTADEWEAELADLDVACARADGPNVAEFAIYEPSNAAQGFSVEVDHPVHGKYLRHGPLMQIEGAPMTPGPICEVGEHTRPILLELGYQADEIADLEARNVVACFDPNA